MRSLAYRALLSAVLVLTAAPAFAAQDYAELTGRKLGRGLSNTALGWVELPGGIQEVGEKHGIGAAATWGVLHGAGRAVQRTAIGVFEVLTFPFGTPENYEPLIEPEFVFGGEKK